MSPVEPLGIITRESLSFQSGSLYHSKYGTTGRVIQNHSRLHFPLVYTIFTLLNFVFKSSHPLFKVTLSLYLTKVRIELLPGRHVSRNTSPTDMSIRRESHGGRRDYEKSAENGRESPGPRRHDPNGQNTGAEGTGLYLWCDMEPGG